MIDLHHTGFDNEKYLREQTAAILERVNRFNNKLYIEFGAKCSLTSMLPGIARIRSEHQDEAAADVEG